MKRLKKCIVVVPLIICILVASRVHAAEAETEKKDISYQDNIDSEYLRQDDVESVMVPTIDLTHSVGQVKYDLAKYTGISARRKAVVLKGLELLMYTKYNLGSKASNLSLEKPTYLDCSGFVQWAILRGTGYDIEHGTAAQYEEGDQIEESDLQVGDLGFKKPGGAQNLGGGNHVGIFVGKDMEGELLWLHCTSGSQDGVNISRHKNLTYYTRPRCYE